MIAYMWVNSFFWSVAPLLGWGHISYEPSGTSCTVVYHPNEGYASYILGCFVFCYILPILALYYCRTQYLKDVIRVTKSAHRVVTLSVRLILFLIFCFCCCFCLNS